MAPGVVVVTTPRFRKNIFKLQIMANQCKLFEKKFETAVQDKLKIKEAFTENPGGGKASKVMDVAGPTATIIISLVGGITLALGAVTFGAASFAGACVVGATLGVKIIDKKIQQNKAKESLTATQQENVSRYLNCVVKDVAKELSRIFELQLFQLKNDKQVEILGACAADLMLDLNNNDTFDRNTLIRKVLQDGKIKKLKDKKVLTRNNTEWSVPDVFRKPGLRKVILEKDVAEIKYFIKPSKICKNKKDVCDTTTYGYRGQFLEMKEYGDHQKEDENVGEEAHERDDLCKNFCNKCFRNDENRTSSRYFVESDIDSKYNELQLEPYRFDALHILIQCPEILVSFSQQSAKPSLASFLKTKFGLRENLQIHPVYRPHSPAKVSNLEKSDLTGSDFSHSDFSDACLACCTFTKCVMLFAELPRAKMSGSIFCDTLISHSNLKGADIHTCTAMSLSLISCSVDGTRLDRNIGGNSLHGTNVSNAIIEKMELNHNKCKYT